MQENSLLHVYMMNGYLNTIFKFISMNNQNGDLKLKEWNDASFSEVPVIHRSLSKGNTRISEQSQTHTWALTRPNIKVESLHQSVDFSLKHFLVFSFFHHNQKFPSWYLAVLFL